MKTANIAIVGATGAVGSTMLSILDERQFPIGQIYPLASSRSAGEFVDFGKRTLEVLDLATFDFSQVDIALFSAGNAVSAKYAPIAARHCVVIDNTSEFRYNDEIPLVVPEVNPQAIANYTTHNIIANPNCSTIQMVVALKPLHDAAGLARINVVTYQSVSGAGRSGVSELVHQTGELLNGRPVNAEIFPAQISFNVIPQIGDILANGYTKEEMKMVWETHKILEDSSIQVNPTTVRVPVLYGHSEAIHIETHQKITAEKARELLRQAPGIIVLDDEKERYPTPISHGSGQDAVYIGRIREDISHPQGLNLWVVADNVRKGAALNAVQIAEIMLRDYL